MVDSRYAYSTLWKAFARTKQVSRSASAVGLDRLGRRLCRDGGTDDLAVLEDGGALGHLTDRGLRAVVEGGLVLVLPVQLAAVRPGEVLGLDEGAQGGPRVPAEDVHLAAGALVEPGLYGRGRAETGKPRTRFNTNTKRKGTNQKAGEDAP